MPILAYTLQLFTALITALWAFVSAWVGDFFATRVLDYVVSLVSTFIEDELFLPIEKWVKGLIESISQDIKGGINSLYSELVELNQAFNFLVCDRFKLELDGLLENIQVIVNEKLAPFLENLISLLGLVFSPIYGLLDYLTSLIASLEADTVNFDNHIQVELEGLAQSAKASFEQAANELGLDPQIKSQLLTKLNNTLQPLVTSYQPKLSAPLLKMASGLGESKRLLDETRANVQAKEQSLSSELNTQVTEAINLAKESVSQAAHEKVDNWLTGLCQQTHAVTDEIQTGLTAQRDKLISLVETATTYSNIGISNLEDELVGKAVHKAIKPHFDKLVVDAKDSIKQEGDKFIQNNDFSNFVNVNEHVKTIKSELDRAHEQYMENEYGTRKHGRHARFTIVDIQRILIHYFGRDERVALMLTIVENDVKIDTSRITQ